MKNVAFQARRAIVAGIAVLSLGAAAPTLADSQARPYGGSCDAVVTVLTPPGVFPQELSIALDCRLRHLGHATGTILQTVTPTGGSGSVVFVDIENVTTYVAANDDELHSTQVGTGTIDVVSGAVQFSLLETYDGGTGRFADASGSSDLEGTASIFTNLGFFTLNGAIGY